jgi:hypothetical protein
MPKVANTSRILRVGVSITVVSHDWGVVAITTIVANHQTMTSSVQHMIGNVKLYDHRSWKQSRKTSEDPNTTTWGKGARCCIRR